MKVVAGLSLSSLNPRVWEPDSPYHLPELRAVMVSYADFHKMPARRRRAMDEGLHASLGVPKSVEIYLDNGAFYFLGREGETPKKEYEDFVAAAKPDWRPIPQDYIPTPKMSTAEQEACFERTMKMNLAYQHDGFVPVIHISPFLEAYIHALKADERLNAKPIIALGGIVPNLLRAPKAMAYGSILESLAQVRQAFQDKEIHVFGIGGTATLHVAALLGMDSVDSSGWRNRAARGMIQLPGSGERVAAALGKWRGRAVSAAEWEALSACTCPACRVFGCEGLAANRVAGFRHRATHNLWVLLNEARLLEEHLGAGSYSEWYGTHLDNTTYRPLIARLLEAQ